MKMMFEACLMSAPEGGQGGGPDKGESLPQFHLQLSQLSKYFFEGGTGRNESGRASQTVRSVTPVGTKWNQFQEKGNSV